MPKFEVWMPNDTGETSGLSPREFSALYEGDDAEEVAEQYLRDSEQVFEEGVSGKVHVALENSAEVQTVGFHVERVLDIVTTLEAAEDDVTAADDDEETR